MALAINLSLPSGVAAKYALVHSVQVDFKHVSAVITVGHYLSSDTCKQGCAPLEIATYCFEGPDTAKFATQGGAYAALKSLPAYAKAADV